MIVKLYSFQPLPNDLRGTFDLQAWPYNGDKEAFEKFLSYLRKYEIFRYEDSAPVGEYGKESINAICVPLHHLKIKQIQDSEFGVPGFRSQCVVDPDTLKIVKFPEVVRQSAQFNGRALSEYYGDDWMWEEFNLEVNIPAYNQKTGLIKAHLKAEKLQSLSGREAKCTNDRSR